MFPISIKMSILLQYHCKYYCMYVKGLVYICISSKENNQVSVVEEHYNTLNVVTMGMCPL